MRRNELTMPVPSSQLRTIRIANMSRRCFLLGSALLATEPARPSLLVAIGEALGELVIGLFEKVVEVGIGLLIESLAANIRDRYLRPRYVSYERLDAVQSYLENGHAADNFCPYCTVEYAKKGQRYWDGQLFLPNEENRLYRSLGRPTDRVLLEITADSDCLFYLRNGDAHLTTSALDAIRMQVQKFEQDKTSLFAKIEQNTLHPSELDIYLMPKRVLRELDWVSEHLDKYPHPNPRYAEVALEVQRLCTWFNTKLISIQAAATRPS